jgi:hypothetical protein
MRLSVTITAALFAILLLTGCGESVGNPFTGSQWDVGVHHVSFSQAVAEWNTADNTLILKFDLLSGSSYPTARVTINEVTTLAVNSPRQATVQISISKDLSFESNIPDPDAQAVITFTRLDLNPLGGVSGTITGMSQNMGNQSEPPVDMFAAFENVPVIN